MRKLTQFVALGLFLAAVFGCGSDTGTANTEKVDVNAAAQKQQGVGGSKAAKGGGLDEGPLGAPPGVKTGMPGPGAKSGG